jgi:gamma-glutamyltranspeptidase
MRTSQDFTVIPSASGLGDETDHVGENSAESGTLTALDFPESAPRTAATSSLLSSQDSQMCKNSSLTCGPAKLDLSVFESLG